MNDVQDMIRKGEAFIGLRKYDDAINALRYDRPPDDPRVHALLAEAYFNRGDARGDLFSAHFFVEKALAAGLTDHKLHAIRALCAFRKERYAEALAAFQAYVTETSPPATQFMVGLCLQHLGRPADALPWFDRAIAEEPRKVEYQEARARAAAALAGQPPGEARAWTKAPQGLGGPRDVRPLDVPSPHRHSAVSKLRGCRRPAADFSLAGEEHIPCQQTCPAGTDIPEYLSAIYRGDYDAAYRINLHDNVFPAVLGRVCSRPCEGACRHGWDNLGEPVAICFSKRSAADFKTQDFVQDAAVVPGLRQEGGGGRRGRVRPGRCAQPRADGACGDGLREAHAAGRHDEPGHPRVPPAPRHVIDKEIEQIRRQGVTIRCNTAIGRDVAFDQLLAEFDAVVMAAGTLRPNVLDLPGKELRGIRHGLDFLLEANDTRGAQVGRTSWSSAAASPPWTARAPRPAWAGVRWSWSWRPPRRANRWS
jgi:hypothetical protein